MKKRYFIIMSLLASFAIHPKPVHAETQMERSMPATSNAHQFSFTSIDGEDLNLNDYSGKVILIVNTASKCGFTGQYKDLQILHDAYKDKGLVVLGVPSGDFAGQEFKAENDVKEFTEEKFKITFPLTGITHVKGKNAHPFYKWAGKQGGFLSGPKWNFHKYLIDANGDYVRSFGSATSPTATSVKTAIEKALTDVTQE